MLSSVIFPSCQFFALLYSCDAGRYTGEGKACADGERNQKAEFLIVTAGEQSGLKGSVLLELSAALSPGVTQVEALITALPECSSPDLCVSPRQCVTE